MQGRALVSLSKKRLSFDCNVGLAAEKSMPSESGSLARLLRSLAIMRGFSTASTDQPMDISIETAPNTNVSTLASKLGS